MCDTPYASSTASAVSKPRREDHCLLWAFHMMIDLYFLLWSILLVLVREVIYFLFRYTLNIMSNIILSNIWHIILWHHINGPIDRLSYQIVGQSNIFPKCCTYIVYNYILIFSLLGRKIARNVMAMATGEAPAEVATTELPEIVKTAKGAVSLSSPFSN